MPRWKKNELPYHYFVAITFFFNTNLMSDRFWVSFDTLFSVRKYPSSLCDTQSNVTCEVFILPPEEGSSLLPPEEGSSLLPPEEGSSLLPPEEGSSLLLPEEGSSLLPPEEGSSLLPPEEGSSLLPLEEGSSLLPPEEGSSLLPPEEGSSSFPPEEGSSLLPFEEGSSSSAFGGESPTIICNFAEASLMSTLSLIFFLWPVNSSCQEPRTSSGIVHEVVRLRAKEKKEKDKMKIYLQVLTNFFIKTQIWLFHVVVFTLLFCRRRQNKYTKVKNACAGRAFCPLNSQIYNVLFAVVRQAHTRAISLAKFDSLLLA